MPRRTLQCWLALAATIVGFSASAPLFAEIQPVGQGWLYTLLEGSQLVDDCPICGRPTIVAPLRGTFQLRLIQQSPIGLTYALVNIDFRANSPGGMSYRVSGTGTYQLTGEIALRQSGLLHISIDNGST